MVKIKGEEVMPQMKVLDVATLNNYEQRNLLDKLRYGRINVLLSTQNGLGVYLHLEDGRMQIKWVSVPQKAIEGKSYVELPSYYALSQLYNDIRSGKTELDERLIRKIKAGY